MRAGTPQVQAEANTVVIDRGSSREVWVCQSLRSMWGLYFLLYPGFSFPFPPLCIWNREVLLSVCVWGGGKDLAHPLQPIWSQREESCLHPSLPPTVTGFPLGVDIVRGLSKAAPYRHDLQAEQRSQA